LLLGGLSQQVVEMLPFPSESHNHVLTDRGLTALKLAQTLEAHQLYALGRVKSNACFYRPATEADYKGRGRRPIYGEKYRADSVPYTLMQRKEMAVCVDEQRHEGVTYRGTFRRRGLKQPVDLIRVEVGDLPPWLLMFSLVISNKRNQ